MKLRQPRPVAALQDRRRAMNLERFALLPREERLSSRLILEPRQGEPDGQPFESVQAMKVETSARIRSLLRYISACDSQPGMDGDAAAARALVDGLRHSTPTWATKNLAIPYFMRRLRDAFGSHLIAAVEGVRAGTGIYVCTIVVKGWSRDPEKLQDTHRDQLLRALKARLYEAGLGALAGWCVFGLHGEFRRASGSFDLHFHGVIVGDKVKAFEALSEVPMFAGGNGKPIRVPIRIDELKNPERQLSYILQGFWPVKYRGETPGADNGLRRRRRRIPEPYHAEHLLWLSRQTFSDIVWLHGIAIRDGFLKPKGEE